MITLDEVLEEMTNEICLNSKADCWEVPVDLYGVIVHYLHEYRSEKVKWEADRKSYQGFVDSYIKSRDKHQAAVIELKHKEKEVNEILTDYVALKQWWAEQQENPPLTWEGLRHIDEKPIWIEVKNGEKKWVITLIDPDDVDRIYITDAYGLRGILNIKMYFKGEIKAYRKERE